jgi:hypothetical protein
MSIEHQRWLLSRPLQDGHDVGAIASEVVYTWTKPATLELLGQPISGELFVARWVNGGYLHTLGQKANRGVMIDGIHEGILLRSSLAAHSPAKWQAIARHLGY